MPFMIQELNVGFNIPRLCTPVRRQSEGSEA